MNKLSFQHFYQLKEMAVARFGRHTGTHINDIGQEYAIWMFDRINKGDGKFKFQADDGTWLTPDQIKKAIEIRADGGKVAPTSKYKPITKRADSAAPATATAAQKSPEDTNLKAPEIRQVPSAAPGAIQAFDPEVYRIKPDWVTEHQKGVRDVFKSSRANIVMPALAGSGKTTMLKDLASNAKPREKWLYLVFNKKNQLESQEKFPPGVDIFTSHSFIDNKVFALNREKIPETNVFDKDKHDPEGYSEAKAEKLINSLVFGGSYVPDDAKGFVKNQAFNLLSKAKNFAVNPKAEALEKRLIEIMEKFGIKSRLEYRIKSRLEYGDDYKAQIVSIASQVLKETLPGVKGGDHRLRNLRDHDDTLWWSAIHADELKWPHYDVVLADEVQDFNVCQQIILKKLSEAGARIIAVGDENQAIYAFRGADAGSFSALEQILGNTSRGVETRNLPVNFRSAPEIIDYVNRNTVVSNLQAGKTHSGQVVENETEQNARSMIDDEWSKKGELDQETAFLARTNAALGPIALEMLVSNIQVTVVGRNLSEEFKQFLTFALSYYKDPDLRYKKGSFAAIRKKGIGQLKFESIDIIPDALREYYDWRSRIPDMSEKKLKEEARTVDNLSDLVGKMLDNDYVDSRGQKIRTVGGLLEYLKDKLRGLNLGTDGGGGDDKDIALFDERQKNPRGHVVLSTIHKSKGLEFERVFVLENDSLPTHEKSQGRKGSKTMKQEEAQEENLKYVAYTRAKNNLHLINSK